MIEDNNFDDLNLDEAFNDNDDDGISLSDVRIQRPQVDPTSVSVKLNESKLSKLEEQLQQVTNMLENGKKTSYIDKILSKYENVDPIFKQMIIDMSMASNEFTKDNIKHIQAYFVDMQKEITQLKEEQKSLSDYAGSIHTDVTMNRLVKKYLERGFKKNTIKEEHVEKAIEEHNKRLNKDEAYVLKLQGIWNTPGASTTTRNRLTGELIFQNFRDVALKAKGKVADSMPDAKKRVDKDEKIEKDKAKMEKLQDKVEESEIGKPSEDDLRRALLKRMRKI